MALLVPAAFTLALSLSAFLLFCIEPLVAKMLLPLLGGVPAVWNACLVFFQGVLLLGYVFALASLRWLGVKQHALLQVILMIAAGGALPIALSADQAVQFASWGPSTQAFALLSLAVGLPFFALSTLAPTLQRWYAATDAAGAEDPYFLYAASNVGSLLSLAAYPVVFEPYFDLRTQAAWLRTGYWLLVGVIAVCALATRRASAFTQTVLDAPPLTLRQCLRWVALAAIPSAYLVALTSHLTTDVAPAPFLWVVPLAAYLVSFVLVFASRVFIAHAHVVRFLPLVMVLLTYLIANDVTLPLMVLVPVHVFAFFGACMLCHGELARERPAPARLNEFYVWMSAGGFLGGLTVSLITPLFVVTPIEYPVCVVLVLLCRPALASDARSGVRTDGLRVLDNGVRSQRLDVAIPLLACAMSAVVALSHRSFAALPGGKLVSPALAALPLLVFYHSLTRPWRFAGVIGGVLLGTSCLTANNDVVLARERNFFGALKVVRDADLPRTRLLHGTTLHGLQVSDAAATLRREPGSYYTRKGPVGDVFEVYRTADTPRRVAVIGLGAGTIAAYAQPAEDWTFYEINPAVLRIASDPTLFTYLTDAFPDPRQLHMIEGDARLQLATQSGDYGVMLIDAFSSDAIPVHLITEEAMALYVTKLASNGILALHISNRMVDLKPVLAALAASQGFAARVRLDSAKEVAPSMRRHHSPSQWVALAKDPQLLAKLGPAWKTLVPRPGFQSWTDQRSSILPVLSATRF